MEHCNPRESQPLAITPLHAAQTIIGVWLYSGSPPKGIEHTREVQSQVTSMVIGFEPRSQREGRYHEIK